MEKKNNEKITLKLVENLLWNFNIFLWFVIHERLFEATFVFYVTSFYSDASQNEAPLWIYTNIRLYDVTYQLRQHNYICFRSVNRIAKMYTLTIYVALAM